MKRRSTWTVSGLFALFCIALLMMTAGSPELRAQRWEGLYGDTLMQFGMYGVQPLSTGGYIAAGFHGGGPSPDVYVVRVGFNGAVVWGNTYDIGAVAAGAERTHCVIECANGDLVVVGHATFSVCNGPNSSDIFVLRLNQFNGALVCVNTIGVPGAVENAWRVIETQFGVPALGTNPGDLVLCGFWSTAANMDPYIVRTDRCGVPIWGRVYNAPLRDELYDIVESRVFPNQGDLIAAGVSNSFNPAQIDEGLLMRVNGNNGFFTTPTHGVAVYSGGNPTGFRTLKETQMSAPVGAIVAAGMTNVPGQANDIYILKTNPNVCFPIVDIIHGDQGLSHDYAEDIQEILQPGGSGALTVGNLVLTGEANLDPLNANDAFLLEIEPNGLTVAGAGFTLYGGNMGDNGRSLRPVYDPGTAWPTDGFIICGGSNGNGLVPPPDFVQLYLIKTDATGSSNCNDMPWGITSVNPGYPSTCVGFPSFPQIQSCIGRTFPVAMNDGYLLCFSYPKAAPGVTAPAEESEVKTYPNPVMKGRSVEVQCTMGEASSATLTVTDIAGNVVLQRGEEFAEGSNRITVSTESWSAGTYLVSVKVGDRVQTQRIVVTE